MEIQALTYPTSLSKSFPESIDADQDGNLYISESYTGALYRYRRQGDGCLEESPELILTGFGRGGARGLCIDRSTATLYFGIDPKEAAQAQIIGFSLAVLDKSSALPLTLKALKATSAELSLPWWQANLSERPNGIVFDPEEQALYYAFTRLVGGYLLGQKGFVEKVSLDPQAPPAPILETRTPNGLDLIRTPDGSALLLTQSAKNSVCRLNLQAGESNEPQETDLRGGGHWLLRHAPDGLHALADGGVLVAGFASGKILLLRREGRGVGSPATLVEGLGNPTDLVIARSSSGSGHSLFVTSMQPLLKGRVFEVLEINREIELPTGVRRGR